MPPAHQLPARPSGGERERERAEKIETHTLRSKSDFGLISSFAADQKVTDGSC